MSKLKFTFHVLIAFIILPVFVYADLTVFFNTSTSADPAAQVEKVVEYKAAEQQGSYEESVSKSTPPSYPHFINY
ncbi:hypothetical protein EXU57_01795 [Segetibacter sp. 3557_3]|uniref:hypothetical protein n=1 Tax=Segetibacter sp. 3557_3 TaxID=2547429 RepID=UPI0010591699|nr:hypothetical protein [Segetibacter sp. 3557_3]TDH28828.1 hypothetical protein EXU57_01795 [Segetibacter sp. 3557_3]